MHWWSSLSNETLTKKASLNSLTTALEYGAQVAVGFIINPLLVAGLGTHGFGIWQVLRQLARLEWMQRRRREIVAAYQAGFADMDALELPVERADVEHAWHLYVIRLRRGALPIDRNAFIRAMTARNIGTSVHFIPVHLHSHYANKYGYAPEDFPIALDNYERMLSLPLSPKMADQDVADVIEAVHDIVKRHRA